MFPALDRKPVRSRRAMTLIELIFVLGLLGIVAALIAPQLAPFFRGRGLREETRRIIALTRYAKSEAVSRSMPVDVKFNVQTGEYGLEIPASYALEGDPVEFKLDERLKFVIDQTQLSDDSSALIRYWPDGMIDESSLPYLFVQDIQKGDALEIAQLDYGLGYEIREVDQVGAGGAVAATSRRTVSGR